MLPVLPRVRLSKLLMALSSGGSGQDASQFRSVRWALNYYFDDLPSILADTTLSKLSSIHYVPECAVSEIKCVTNLNYTQCTVIQLQMYLLGSKTTCSGCCSKNGSQTR